MIFPDLSKPLGKILTRRRVNNFLLNENYGGHSLTKGTESWRDELKMYRKFLFFESRWDVNLYFKVEHLVPCNGLAYFKKVFLLATSKVIYQKAAGVPVVFRFIENLELDESCLTSLHCGMIFILRTVLLLWHVFTNS